MRYRLAAAVLFASTEAGGCDGGSGDDGNGGTEVCTAGEKTCDGDDVVKCNADGSDWAFFKTCADGCSNGECGGGGACQPACAGKACGDDGCGGSCGSCGGNTTCQGGKCLAGSCVPDCAGMECGSDGCGGECGTCSNGVCVDGQCGCYDSSDCDEVSVCYGAVCSESGCATAGQCTLAYGRAYRIEVSGATIMEGTPTDGSAWDAVGGMPDPFATCDVGGVTVYTTATLQDTLSPYWAESFVANIIEGAEISFRVYDEDIAANDYVGGFQFESGLPIEIIKAGWYDFLSVDPANGILGFTFFIQPE